MSLGKYCDENIMRKISQEKYQFSCLDLANQPTLSGAYQERCNGGNIQKYIQKTDPYFELEHFN